MTETISVEFNKYEIDDVCWGIIDSLKRYREQGHTEGVDRLNPLLHRVADAKHALAAQQERESQ